MSLTINLIPDIERQVVRDAKREGVAPEVYLNKLLSRYLQRERLAIPKGESNLLEQINAGLPEKIWQRLEYLRSQLEADSLTDAEQQELIQIADSVEEANVRRVNALIQLAELRNIAVEKLMDELDIHPPAYV